MAAGFRALCARLRAQGMNFTHSHFFFERILLRVTTSYYLCCGDSKAIKVARDGDTTGLARSLLELLELLELELRELRSYYSLQRTQTQ